MNKKIKIILPCYNAEKTILNAIQSVLNQTIQDWILYVIDDASTDNTIKVIKDIVTDKRIVLLKNGNNRGVAESRNKGLANAVDGDYVFFLDADDFWEENKLAEQLPLLEMGRGIVITEYVYVGGKRNNITYKYNVLSKEDFIYKKFRVCFSSLSFIFTDGIYFQRKGHEDFLFILDLISHYQEISIINKRLVVMYKTMGSLSSNKNKAALWHWDNLGGIYKAHYFTRVCAMISYILRGVLFSVKNK